MPFVPTSAHPSGDVPVTTPFKLAALWASTTLCYLYCDYFALYAPGKLQGMLQGQMGPLGEATPGVLLGASAFLSIPCLMVALTLVTPPRISRGMNLVAGLLFTAIMALIVPGRRGYYQFWGVLEILLTLAIVGLSIRWTPTTPGPDRG